MSSFILFSLLFIAFHYGFMILAITNAELKTVVTAGSLFVGKLPTLLIQYKTILKAGTKKGAMLLLPTVNSDIYSGRI